jgi:CheY-like chemotaxis protein
VSRQARILLVDDRPENLVALEAILSSLDQILVPVRSGEQAVQAVLAEEYAVVLMDIMMPGMDGFETATQIKRHARGRDVPIIFLTAADARPEQAFRGYAAGAVDYLAKPFDPWVLNAKVSGGRHPASPAGRPAARYSRGVRRRLRRVRWLAWTSRRTAGIP